MTPAQRSYLRLAIVMIAGFTLGTLQTRLMAHHPIASSIATIIVMGFAFLWGRGWFAQRRDPNIVPPEDRDD